VQNSAVWIACINSAFFIFAGVMPSLAAFFLISGNVIVFFFVVVAATLFPFKSTISIAFLIYRRCIALDADISAIIGNDFRNLGYLSAMNGNDYDQKSLLIRLKTCFGHQGVWFSPNKLVKNK